MSENMVHNAETDALLRDLRNPMIDVAESEAALQTYIEREREKAYNRGQSDAFMYATTEQYRWYGQPDDGIPNPYATSVTPPGRGAS